MSAHRVTVVSDQRVLIASDIERWRGGSNTERVFEFNGRRLSPHIDALFNDHQTSFDDDSRAHTDPSLFAGFLCSQVNRPAHFRGVFFRHQQH